MPRNNVLSRQRMQKEQTAAASSKFLLLFAGTALLLTAIALTALQARSAQPEAPVSVLQFTLKGGIGPAQSELTREVLQKAQESNFSLVLLTLDTPGGLVTSMRDIVQTMLNSPVPVLVWVGPSGARAASAGVFVVAASSVAGMAPQTTMGAASPVGPAGADIQSTMQDKVVNDLSSLVRAIAGKQNRNVEWYQQAVQKAVSITAKEAVSSQVVEIVSNSEKEFLVQAGILGVPLPTGEDITQTAPSQTTPQRLHFTQDDVSITTFQPSWKHSFLSWLLDPQIAYLLFLAGIGCLFLEFTHAGAILPGALGALCLLLGLYALTILPANATGMLLILLGLILFIMELKIPSYGLLSIGAALCLLIGSIILFPSESSSGDTMQLSLGIILPTVLTITAVMGGAAYVAVRALRTKPVTGSESFKGDTAQVIQWRGRKGRIRYQGTTWRARFPHEEDVQNALLPSDWATPWLQPNHPPPDFSTFSPPLSRNHLVLIHALEGLTIIVTPIPPTENT